MAAHRGSGKIEQLGQLAGTARAFAQNLDGAPPRRISEGCEEFIHVWFLASAHSGWAFSSFFEAALRHANQSALCAVFASTCLG